MMESILFNYNRKIGKFISQTILPFLGLSSLFALNIIVIVASLKKIFGISSSGTFNSSPFVWIIFLLFFLVAVYFAVAIHISQPAIRVKNNCFQLRTVIYKSKWMSWDQLLRIREIKLPIVSVFAVECPDLNFFYSLAGKNAGFWGRAFIIRTDINDFDKLMTIIKYHRPDLFTEENDSTSA